MRLLSGLQLRRVGRAGLRSRERRRCGPGRGAAPSRGFSPPVQRPPAALRPAPGHGRSALLRLHRPACLSPDRVGTAGSHTWPSGGVGLPWGAPSAAPRFPRTLSARTLCSANPSVRPRSSQLCLPKSEPGSGVRPPRWAQAAGPWVPSLAPSLGSGSPAPGSVHGARLHTSPPSSVLGMAALLEPYIHPMLLVGLPFKTSEEAQQGSSVPLTNQN